MADLAITAANVLKGANAVFQAGIAGATITAGQPLYLDSNTNTYKLADADASAAAATVVGVSLNGASSGQPVSINFSDDDFTTGGTMTVGAIYILSNNAGGVTLASSLTTGWYPNVVYIAKSTTKAVLAIAQQVTAAVP